MKLKLITLLLIAAMLVTVIASCDNGNTTTTTEGTTSNGQTTASETTGEVSTIIVYTIGLGDASDAPLVAGEINKIAADMIGVEIELNFVNFGAWQDQMNLMLSSGEQIDLMNNGFVFPIANLVSNGQIQAIDDYVAEYGQGIVEALGQDYVNAGMVGGKLYGITNNRDLAASYGYVARTDLMDQYNLSFDGVESLADLEPILKTIKDNEPSLYPLTAQAAPSMRVADWGIDNCGDTNNLGVLLNQGQETTFKNYYESDDFVEWCETIYDFAQKGLVMPDILSSTDSGDAIMKSGKSFGYVTNLKPGFDTQTKMQTGMDINIVELSPAQSSTSNAASLCWVVPSSAKYPAEAVKLLNLWNTDADISNLFIYGVEGTHYQVIDADNDIIDYAEGVDASSIKYPVSMGWNIGNQFISHIWNGNPADYWEQMDAFNKGAIISKAMGFTFDSSSISTEYAACSSVVAQYNNALLCGAIDPATAIPEFNSALKDAGLDIIIAEKQAQLDAWMANQ